MSLRLEGHLPELSDGFLKYLRRAWWLERLIQTQIWGERGDDLRAILVETDALVSELSELWNEYLVQFIDAKKI
jgi:hypothetical protein